MHLCTTVMMARAFMAIMTVIGAGFASAASLGAAATAKGIQAASEIETMVNGVTGSQNSNLRMEGQQLVRPKKRTKKAANTTDDVAGTAETDTTEIEKPKVTPEDEDALAKKELNASNAHPAMYYPMNFTPAGAIPKPGDAINPFGVEKVTGETGPRGPAGGQGLPGPAGLTGLNGVVGLPGEVGPLGKSGLTPTAGEITIYVEEQKHIIAKEIARVEAIKRAQEEFEYQKVGNYVTKKQVKDCVHASLAVWGLLFLILQCKVQSAKAGQAALAPGSQAPASAGAPKEAPTGAAQPSTTTTVTVTKDEQKPKEGEAQQGNCPTQ